MPKANTLQTNWSSGEISPLTRGRVDVAQYQSGAEQIRNFHIKSQGSLWRRSGSEYLGSVKTGTSETITYEFEFSNIQAYILEFGNYYMRIWKDGALVESAPGVPVEVVTPWESGDLGELYFAQSADVLYVSHPDYPTRTISRTSDTAWALATYDPMDGPYLATNSTAVSMTLAVSVNQLVLGSAAALFAVGNEGKYVEFREENQWRLGLIQSPGGYLSSTIVIVDLQNTVRDLDSDTKLTAKLSGVQRSTITEAPQPGSSDQVRYEKVKGRYVIAGSTIIKDGIDPSNLLVGASGAVTANLGGTFTRGDVGKFVRTGKDVWWLITAFQTDLKVTATVVPGGSIVSYAYPANIVTPYNPSSRSQVGTVLASAAVFSASDAETATIPGRKLRLNYGGKWISGKIVGVTAGNTVAIVQFVHGVSDFSQDFIYDPQNGARLYNEGTTKIWRLGAWSVSTGWPSKLTFHEQRLWFACTDAQPQTLWGSVSGDYENMAPTEPDGTVLDDSAVSATLASNKINAINWLNSGPTLLIGTLGSEWQLRAASSVAEPITPANVQAQQQSAYGSEPNILPRRIGTAVLFVQRGGRKVREMTYSYELDSYVSKDITIASEHILRDGVRAIKSAVTLEPTPTYWLVLSDGSLASCTYDRDQNIVAWSRHELGGFSALTDGLVKSIASIPSTAGTEDDLYMVVQRTINGVTKRYLERLMKDFFPLTGTYPFHVDCGIQSTQAAATTITGLTHLEGRTVALLSGLTYLGTFVVSGGQITGVGASVTDYVVGLPFTSTLKQLPPEGGSPFGTSQVKTKRIHRVGVRVYNTINFKQGVSLSGLVEETLDSTYFTGDWRFALNQAFQTEAGYYIVQDDPLPLILLQLAPEFHTNE